MIFKQVAEIVGESNCLTEALQSYAVDGMVPKLVVFPENVEQVSALMKLADQERLVVIPRGSGTKMSLGNIPKQVDMVLVLKKLNKILEYEPDDLTATVEAGILLTHLQGRLKEKNQCFPLDPPFSSEATLGGIVATNSNGPGRFFHGSVRDLVVGIRVVHPGGVIARAGGKVVKNVSGYDMNKLYTGSLGTLGIITELSLKLRPLPEVSKTLLLRFSSLSEAARLVLQISTSELLPTALEILDSKAWQRMNRTDPSINPGQVGSLSLETDPGVAASGVTFAAKLEGLSENVERQIIQIREWGQQKGATGAEVLDGDLHGKFWEKIQNHPQTFSADASNTLCCKASLPASKVEDFFQAVKKIGNSQNLDPVMFSHAGSGIVYIYLGLEAVPTGVDRISIFSYLIKEIRNLSIQFEGSLVVEAAPTDLKKKVDVWGPVGDSWKIMKLLKEQFDPHGILNPGRFIEGI
ncbi:MAG TPA: FAD-binding oxidoreductase [Candidatus Limnocylindrales bacterium]|nr:FAD-binding oxidoreductase [Candidatus Limnocylindrales bacterium]